MPTIIYCAYCFSDSKQNLISTVNIPISNVILDHTWTWNETDRQQCGSTYQYEPPKIEYDLPNLMFYSADPCFVTYRETYSTTFTHQPGVEIMADYIDTFYVTGTIYNLIALLS